MTDYSTKYPGQLPPIQVSQLAPTNPVQPSLPQPAFPSYPGNVPGQVPSLPTPLPPGSPSPYNSQHYGHAGPPPSIWDKYDTVSASVVDRRPRLPLGPVVPTQYLVEIQECMQKFAEHGSKPAFIAEFTVVQSLNNPGVQPGYESSWYRDMANPQVARPYMKKFIAAILGFDFRLQGLEAQFDAQVASRLNDIMSAVIGEQQYFRGRRAIVMVIPGKKINPETGQAYTNYEWRVAG